MCVAESLEYGVAKNSMRSSFASLKGIPPGSLFCGESRNHCWKARTPSSDGEKGVHEGKNFDIYLYEGLVKG